MKKSAQKQNRFLSQAIQLEEAVNPHIINATMSLVSCALIVFLIWAGLTNINEVARTSGEVVPQGHQQMVQHLTGGLIQTILVHEGDIVSKDQVLLTIQDAGLNEDLNRAQGKQLSLELEEERLRAFVDMRIPNFSQFTAASESLIEDQKTSFEEMKKSRDKEEEITRAQIAQKEQAISSFDYELKTTQQNKAIIEDVYNRQVRLNQQGLSSDMQLLDSQQKLNTIRGDIQRLNNQRTQAISELREAKGRLSSVTAKHRDEAYQKLSVVSAEKAQNAEMVRKIQDQIDRLAVRAPTHGLVKGMTVNTVNAVIAPGQTLMEIVPIDEQLEVQVKISPKDIGHLKQGQNVELKFSSYDFSRYGSTKGKLKQISATTFAGQNGERFYQGRIALVHNYVGKNPANTILPGMTVMADIITGKKTILQYLLKPIDVSLRTAFKER